MIDDVDALARRAREALAQTGGGTLHIHGVGALDARSADILLYDDAGRPTFLCDPCSPVTDAAGRGLAAVLCVLPPRPVHDVTGVVLAGSLAIVGTEHVEGAEVMVIGLQVCTVLLEHDDPSAPNVVQLEIPIDRYRSSAPDPLDAAANRILRHTNEQHGAELREFVAGVRGVPIGEIAAAEISVLDIAGVDIRWLDQRGAHAVRIVFPAPADSPGTLATRLRETLAGSRR